MTAQVKIVADSISPNGIRITTFQLRYWRAIHSELMTHRVFSRNASSSRAIPVNKMIEQVENDPAMPIRWGSNKPGMQAGVELVGRELQLAKWTWLQARDEAVAKAHLLIQAGLHKQVANRLLEPWQYISVVLTATNFDNFFNLRCHPDAQPEIQELATMMRDARLANAPVRLQPGQWHLPYVTDADLDVIDKHVGFGENSAYEVIDLAAHVSAARCCRVSYLKHDGTNPSIEDDLELCEKLMRSRPIHASPFEHQATPDVWDGDREVGGWDAPDLWGNFTGWVQYRKMLEESLDA